MSTTETIDDVELRHSQAIAAARVEWAREYEGWHEVEASNLTRERGYLVDLAGDRAYRELPTVDAFPAGKVVPDWSAKGKPLGFIVNGESLTMLAYAFGGRSWSSVCGSSAPIETKNKRRRSR